MNLPAKDKALAGAPQPLFTVGREEGEGQDVFSVVQAVAFDASGNLLVLDRDNARVVVFGPDGRLIRSIGKKGEGPGEKDPGQSGDESHEPVSFGLHGLHQTR